MNVQVQQLTSTESVPIKGRCKVHGGTFNATGNINQTRLMSVGICADCDFWVDKWQMRDDPNVARVNGEHYIIGSQLDDYEVNPNDSIVDIVNGYNSDKKTKGMGGQKYLIHFYGSDKMVITDDLWHQGTIPERFERALPNNAVFVRLMGV